MGAYNDLDRASRDLQYRISYEAERRQEKIAREVSETLARAKSGGSKKKTDSSDFVFTFPAPSGSSASDPVSDEAFGAGLAVGVAIILGLCAYSFIATYGYLILKGAAILALLGVLTVLAVKFWRTVGAFVTVPLIWVCWVGVAWVLLWFRINDAVVIAVASLAALWLGTGIWPRRKLGERLAIRFLAALQWLCQFVLPLLVFFYVGPLWNLEIGIWIGGGAALLTMGLVWSGFRFLRR